jgi:hypothetical protein
VRCSAPVSWCSSSNRRASPRRGFPGWSPCRWPPCANSSSA